MIRAPRRDVRLVDTCTSGVLRDVDGTQGREHGVNSDCPLGNEVLVDEALLDEGGEQRAEQPRVAARPYLEVDVSEVGRLASLGIDDDETAIGVARDLLQDHPSSREAVRLPRVLPPEHRDLSVLVVTRRVAARLAEQLSVHPELAGLLLGRARSTSTSYRAPLGSRR